MPVSDGKILKVQFRKPARFTRVAEGIYRYQDGKTLYEHLRLNGRQTWRKLHSLTLADARQERAARHADLARAKLGLAENPYTKTKPVRVQAVLEFYQAKGFPNAKGKVRSPRTQLDERRRMAHLQEWWGNYLVSEITFKLASDYGRHRTKGRTGRGSGGRAVDLDLWTLENALRCALRFGLIERNPLAGNKPTFGQEAPRIRSRERMPDSADELHQLARTLFSNPKSEALGWQLLIEALTGMRTSECRGLRIDAQRREDAGYIEDGWLFLHRLKRGVNPFALIHADLAECIEAHHTWLKRRWPKSPWWIPSYLDRGMKPVDVGALGHALARITKQLGLPHRTSHGLRAYYVSVRRSQGIADAQIAAEIGDATGASIIAETYGAIPRGWRGEGERLGWRPKEGAPAWAQWL